MAMSFDLSGRRALVTGGASGIGRGIVEALARAGARVFLTYSSSAEAAEALVAASNGAIGAAKADLRSEAGCVAAVAAASAFLRDIDILVTNAGGLIAREPTISTTQALWQDTFDLNVISTVFCVKAALPGMLARQRGAIVTMGSIAAHNGGSNAAAYAAMKGAIHTFTRALAKEAAPHVRVNGVSPGLIGTRFHDIHSTPERRRGVVEQTPLKREGTPEDVAAAVLYLASDASSFLSGEIIEVNGGIGMF